MTPSLLSITENNINTDPSNNLNENIVRHYRLPLIIYLIVHQSCFAFRNSLEYTETYDMSDNLISREFFNFLFIIHNYVLKLYSFFKHCSLYFFIFNNITPKLAK